MKQSTLLLAVIFVFSGSAAIAQPDTSKYDLGSLKLNKNFTQNITIRGADLEKMPFTNLSDALAPWLYGAYTTPGTVAYVVDGNPVSDVNAYSVFDIEEVVLVQQAAGLVGTFGTQQQLVLIRTKRGKGKQGVTVGAQTGLVNAGGNGVKTGTSMYHQYYARAYRNLSKISYGLSGDYQRDVFPIQKEEDIKSTTPVDLQRWRLNGYFTWRPNAANQIEATMNYAPQHGNEDISSTGGAYQLDFNSHVKQHLVLPRLLWHSDILPGLKNDLQVAFLSSRYTANSQILESASQGNPTLIVDHIETKGSSLRANERISYELSSGGWKIEPALNASYEHVDQKFTSTSSTAQNILIGPPYSLSSGTSIATSTITMGGKANVYILTPAVDITFNRALNINGGVFLDVSGSRFRGARKSSAFASVAVDLLQLGKEESDNNLKIFASYAQQTMLTNNNYALGDLTNGTSVTPVAAPAEVVGSVGTISNPQLLVSPILIVPSYWVWESGVSWSILQHRLELNYTLEQRRPSALSYLDLPYGNFNPYLQQWHSTLHHFGARVKILDGAGLRWESGLNITLLKGKTDTSNYVEHNGKPGIGEFNSDPFSWTGGFVNRLRLGQFTAGLDLLYHFHETAYTTANNLTFTPYRVNSFVIPNIYAGYDLHLPHGEGLELFAESRGLVRNHSQDLMDARRYYTIGGKFTIQ